MHQVPTQLCQELQEQLVQQAPMVYKDPKAQQVLLVLQDQLVLQALKVHKVLMEPLLLKAERVLLVYTLPLQLLLELI